MSSFELHRITEANITALNLFNTLNTLKTPLHKSYQRYLPFFPTGRQPFGMLCPPGNNAFGHPIEFCLGEVVKQHFPIYFLYYASRFTFMTMSFCLSTFYIVGLLIWAPNTPNIVFNNLHLNVTNRKSDVIHDIYIKCILHIYISYIYNMWLIFKEYHHILIVVMLVWVYT